MTNYEKIKNMSVQEMAVSALIQAYTLNYHQTPQVS